ncbi:MAG TPA: ATP-binding cassette domain-containing protein [Gammaproteobacteria bacterium]|nr:ATP-binding cassette domain-containing protein [Gammaproteobacteria bacterium]
MTASYAAAIELRDVTKTFGSQTAVSNLDLSIPRGALYGFIGPNGAGKTTSIRMIMSILFPDSGELTVLGHSSALEAKDKIGYLPEERGVYRKMRVGAYLAFIAKLKGVPEKGLAERVRTLVARVGLAGVESKRCEELSKGMSQKIQFVAAILHEPELLILDEPFSGLDPVSMRLLREQIVAEHERGATILFSTHVMQQAEEICDHVVMIHRGRKVLDDPVSSIRRRYDPRALVLEPLDAAADVARVRALAEVESCAAHDGAYDVELRAGVDPAAAIARIAGVLPLARIEVKRSRLEDVFVQLVADGAESAEATRALRAELAGHAERVAT